MSEKNTTVNKDETRIDPVEQEIKMNPQEKGNNADDDVPKGSVRAHYRKVTKGVAIGGLGMMAGIVGAMGLQAFREAPSIENPEGIAGGGSAIPEPTTLDEIQIAHSPDDEMSFNEAFAAARQEVGANGVFEWRGNVYGTYYADEWNNFSDEYKENFSNHDWASEFPDDPDTPGSENLAEENVFGEHTINTDEEGNQYITITDAITGEEVRITPEDIKYAVLDERGELVGIIGEDVLASVDGEDGCLILDEEGNLQEFVNYEDYFVELIETDEDGVAILNGPDGVDIMGDDALLADMIDDDAVVIDEDIDGEYDIVLVEDDNSIVLPDSEYEEPIIAQEDNIADYLDDNDLPDYTNDAPVDDFIV